MNGIHALSERALRRIIGVLFLPLYLPLTLLTIFYLSVGGINFPIKSAEWSIRFVPKLSVSHERISALFNTDVANIYVVTYSNYLIFCILSAIFGVLLVAAHNSPSAYARDFRIRVGSRKERWFRFLIATFALALMMAILSVFVFIVPPVLLPSVGISPNKILYGGYLYMMASCSMLATIVQVLALTIAYGFPRNTQP